MSQQYVLSGNFFLFGLVSLASDQVYSHYKFSDGAINRYNAFCYFDNYFYGWYYRLCTVVYLIMAGLLMRPDLLPPQSPFWRVAKQLMHFSFFAECEAICQFIYVSRSIEYLIEDVSDQQLIYLLVLLAVMRWALALFGTNNTQLALEALAYEHYDYSIAGHGLTTNRTKLNQHYGWISQFLADYLVVHYLAYQALFKSENQFHLDGKAYTDTEQFYRHQAMVGFGHRVLNGIYFALAGGFYLKFVRKEVTFYNFIV